MKSGPPGESAALAQEQKYSIHLGSFTLFDRLGCKEEEPESPTFCVLLYKRPPEMFEEQFVSLIQSNESRSNLVEPGGIREEHLR